MNNTDLALLKDAHLHLSTAIKAFSESAPTQSLVEIQAAAAKLQSILSRNPL